MHHPTSSWWNKDKGREKFIKIIEKLLPKDFLKESLLDERIWLMRSLFNDMEKVAKEKGYNVKICPDYYIVDYYVEGRNPDRLPYLDINDGDKEVKIEIDSRLYFWKNEKEWEYLSLDNKILDSRKKHCFITRNVIIEGFRHIITRYILFCITREECYCIGIYGLPRYTFRECRIKWEIAKKGLTHLTLEAQAKFIKIYLMKTLGQDLLSPVLITLLKQLISLVCCIAFAF